MSKATGGSLASALSLTASRSLPGWLAKHQVSLLLSTYQVGKVLALGLTEAGKLALVERNFPHCMGLTVADQGQSIWLSSQSQIWHFANFLAPGAVYEGYDRLYVPQSSSVTGDVDTHDMGVCTDGSVVFVNTLFNCLATPAKNTSFTALWKPSFISKLAAEDRCHLNGLALDHGQPRYVSAVSRSDVVDGWRDHRHDGGVVIDLRDNSIVCEGLSMPHSPRVYQGRLYIHNSGRGEFGWIDVANKTFHPLAFCPGYLRGLDFVGNYAVVGLSRPRTENRFSGLALDDELKKRHAEARCGLLVIDLSSGDAVEWLTFDGIISELYDVALLPGARRPMIIGTQGDEIHRMVRFDDQCAETVQPVAGPA